jgi:TRAP-type transport system small permease protein
MMQRAINIVCKGLGALMVFSMALMVVLVFGNVVMRYGFKSGFTVSEELSRWLFVWMTFLGAVVALNERGHLGTDSLIVRLPLVGKRICLGISYAAMLYILWLVFEGALKQAIINYTTTSAVMEISVAIFYASGLVSAVLGAIVIAYNLWRLVSGQMPESELLGVRESEEVPHADQRGKA